MLSHLYMSACLERAARERSEPTPHEHVIMPILFSIGLLSLANRSTYIYYFIICNNLENTLYELLSSHYVGTTAAPGASAVLHTSCRSIGAFDTVSYG